MIKEMVSGWKGPSSKGASSGDSIADPKGLKPPALKAVSKPAD